MRCIICGCRDVVEVPCESYGKNKCPRCRHVWFALEPGASRRYHEETPTWEYKNLAVRDAMALTRKRIVCRALGRRPRSVLDVGCGDGSFLCSFSDRVRRVGLDINRTIPSNSDVEVFSVPVTEFVTKEKFDVVTSIHSLEHMEDCVSAMKAILALSENVCAVEVPVDRRMHCFLGHVHGFSRKSFHVLVDCVRSEFDTVLYKSNLQNRSELWVGRRRATDAN